MTNPAFDNTPANTFGILELLPGKHSQRIRIILPFQDLARTQDLQVAVSKDSLVDWCRQTLRTLGADA